MNNFFYNIYQYFNPRKWIGFGVLGILFFAVLFIASKIKFEEDITKLIPSNKENLELQKVLKNVNFTDKIIINITKETAGSVDDLTQYASQLIDSINKSSSKYIKQIQGKIDDDQIGITADFIYKNLPLFLDENDYKTIESKIQKDSITAITLKNYKTLISPSGIVAKDFILNDPLGLSYIALKKLQELSFGNDFNLQNGFLVSKDKKHILLFITPILNTNETAENTLFAKNLYEDSAKLNTQFKNRIRSEYFGGTLIAVANANQIKHDITITTSITLTILLLIFIFFYKKISVVIILFLPTLFGGLLAVAFLFLLREKISAISLGIGSVLLGVTLDYSLHIITHIRSNNNVGNLYKEISRPILMSSLTTSLAFLCLLFINSQALQDLGIFAAISVMGTSCFALLFIPQVYKEQTTQTKRNTLLDKIASYNIHSNKWVIMTLFLMCFGSFFTYNTVVFNNDLSQLNYMPKELKTAELRLDKLTNSTSKSIYIAAYGNSEENTLQVNDEILSKLQKLKTENKIINFSSIGTFVHSKKYQNQQIEKWNSFWDEKTKQNTKQNIIESGIDLGFKPETFNAFYSLLNTTFKPLESNDYKAIKVFSVEDYISTKDNYTTITTLVKVEHGDAVVSAFKNKSKTLVIDRKQINETFLGNLKNDFNNLIGYSLLVVILILILFYKSFSLTLVTSIPICLTWLLTIGIMGLFHVHFNIFNIIISTFIFGLGIDYSIFITNGLLHEYRTGEQSLNTHKTSILLSVITTILGVGVLVFAKHPALYSISLVCLIGILSAALIAFTIQPLLFKLFIGSKQKRPISLRLLIHSIASFTYFGLGGILLSLFSVTILKIIPLPKKTKMKWFHVAISKFMKSVLYTNRFLVKKVINEHKEDFKKQAIIIANHTSFLDILAIGMLNPKIIFLVSDWVYNSPVFGKAVQLAGFYPVSNGIDNGLDHLKKKIDQGYSLMVFPEGTRSKSNKIKRFHKGAFYLAEHFNLDLIPVLIHGNSEVIPKGESMIRNGHITLKIIERITPNDLRFNPNYSIRSKEIGSYFRAEFSNFRKERETATYFHKIVLDDYRYKGDALYHSVKNDIKSNKDIYQTILKTVGEKDIVLHLSNDAGQLDFLLALNAIDRKIISYIKNVNNRTIVKNSFITHTKNITCADTTEELLPLKANTLILSNNCITEDQLKSMIHTELNCVIFLKESRHLLDTYKLNLNFECTYQTENSIILTKQIKSA
ncbi:MMPL family transporter [Cellulophaga sp. E16_2]|uniref:1-acyl-sn-glycerol-3-phosphate acyltransferase n=1 Tax=Cellulophaga sp. E16_2 TaxID=2789297 RepID=UPI001A90EBBC|nr:1-acyl-sn-glycerol-3-phosphate acyltransferase [Cellulophaga sp. E16_2]MBO0591069.1 MMPL family transporter [Cellulophaga sp. E16_2]